MAKRSTDIKKGVKSRHSHKTAKRLAIKHEMLAAKKANSNKKRA